MIEDKKLLIFDMDGTILNTLEDLQDSLNYVLKKYNHREITLEETRKYVGNGSYVYIDNATGNRLTKEQIDEMLTIYLPYYEKHCMNKTKPYEGIIETIYKLREKGYITAVVSNKPDVAVASLCESMFDGCFDIYCGEKVGMNRKPAPDMVNYVMDKMGIGKERSLYIGDSEVDILTAQNTGIDYISVTWGFRDREHLVEHGAKVMVERPEEILSLL